MNILDFDLDFFLANCCPLAKKGERPSVNGCFPWQEKDIRSFLENNCKLSKTNKITGRIFQTHDMALCYWHELIEQGKLVTPFSVTHIDAHSDLGIGYPGPGFVLNTVISTRLEKRVAIQRYYDMNELDEANYLLFALSFRWISSLTNVRNPKSRPDMPKQILLSENTIKLQSFASKLLEPANGAEPCVSYTEFSNYTEYAAKTPFDYVSFAISPRYLPQEADFIADIVSEYIK